MTSTGIARENYLDLKSKSKGVGRVWKRKWVVLRQMSDLTTKTFVAKLDMYADYESYKSNNINKKKMTFVLENVTSVKKIPSSTRGYAFQVLSDQAPLFFAGSTESDSQGWMKALRRIFWPPAKTCADDEFEVAVVETQASVRLCMESDYSLKVTHKDILLNSEYDCSTVFTWPFTTLKRFELASLSPNAIDKKKMLHILAGPSSTTGEGDFFFYSEKAEDIFNAIVSAISSPKQRSESSAPPSPGLLNSGPQQSISTLPDKSFDPNAEYDTLDNDDLGITRTMPKPKTCPLPAIPPCDSSRQGPLPLVPSLSRKRSVPNILETMPLPDVPLEDDVGHPLPDALTQSREASPAPVEPFCYEIGENGMALCVESIYAVPPDRTIAVQRSDGYSVIQSLYSESYTPDDSPIFMRKTASDAKSHSDSLTSSESESRDSGVGTADQRISQEIEKDEAGSKNEEFTLSDEQPAPTQIHVPSEDPYSNIDELNNQPQGLLTQSLLPVSDDRQDSSSAHYSEIGDLSNDDFYAVPPEDFYAVPPENRGLISDDTYAVPLESRGLSRASYSSNTSRDEVTIEVTAPDDEEPIYEELTDFIKDLKTFMDTKQPESAMDELDELLKHQKGNRNLKKMLLKRFGVTEEELLEMKSSQVYAASAPNESAPSVLRRSMSTTPAHGSHPPAIPQRSMSVFIESPLRKSKKFPLKLPNLFKKHTNSQSFDESEDDTESDKQLSPKMERQRKSFDESKINRVDDTSTSPKLKERRRSKSHEGNLPHQIKAETALQSPDKKSKLRLKNLFKNKKTKKGNILSPGIEPSKSPTFDNNDSDSKSESHLIDHRYVDQNKSLMNPETPVDNLISLDDLDIPNPTPPQPMLFHSLQRPPKKKNQSMPRTPLESPIATPPIPQRGSDIFRFDSLLDSTEVMSPMSNASFTPSFLSDLSSPRSDSDPFDLPCLTERSRVSSSPTSTSPGIDTTSNANLDNPGSEPVVPNWVTFDNDKEGDEWSSFCSIESRRKASQDSMTGFGNEYLDMGGKQNSPVYVHPPPCDTTNLLEDADPNSSSC